MAVSHLNDDELQAYLDGELERSFPLRVEHLKSCPSCREQLQQYILLYDRLEEQPSVERPGFADDVLARIEEPEKSISAVREFIPFLAAGTAVVAAVAALLYFDLWPGLTHYWSADLGSWLESVIAMPAVLVARVLTFLTEARVDLWGTPLAILLLMALADRALRHIRRQDSPISFTI